jgi:hypothetical protein
MSEKIKLAGLAFFAITVIALFSYMNDGEMKDCERTFSHSYCVSIIH